MQKEIEDEEILHEGECQIIWLQYWKGNERSTFK